MENRIRQLREKRGLTQETLAIELEITQQQLSKYERNIASIKVESLKKVAAYFNVTTDYLLGTSDVKRDVVVELYRGLKQCDQKIILAIIAIIKNASGRKE